MRTQFIECKTYKTAYTRCPWAAKVMKVFGGFIAFEWEDDYRIAKRQKMKTALKFLASLLFVLLAFLSLYFLLIIGFALGLPM